MVGGSCKQAVWVASPDTMSQRPPPAFDRTVLALPPSGRRSITTRRPVLTGLAPGVTNADTCAVLMRGNGPELNVAVGGVDGATTLTVRLRVLVLLRPCA